MEEKHRILYVDDEPQNLISFKASFRQDYTIFTVNSGQEAINFLNKQKVDLIITDQRMPRMTGVELFEKILPEFPEPIRMVITGYSDINAVIDAINKGKVYHYITKPWNAQELKLIIDNALESGRLKKENRTLLAEKNELMLQAERQEKENILSRYESLKNQVNPHFLFNSLNTLAALVYEDPALAEKFITKLTKVYRYVLEHKEEILVTVQEELRFMENYVFLQKIRFTENLRLNIDINPVPQQVIPPMTVQLLVENAIKHNVITRDKPLFIDIYIEEFFLVVRNTYQKREPHAPSTGIGLQNLTERYSFLSDMQPKFFIEDSYYIAKIPLLNLADVKEFMPGNRMSNVSRK